MPRAMPWGKLGRCVSAAPIAVSRLVARARCSISCLVNLDDHGLPGGHPGQLLVAQPLISAALEANWANRYSHISPCSSSQAWPSSHTRALTRNFTVNG